jgi:predicted nucleic acid-binding protein
MMPVFADASYYVALLNPRDQHHEDSVRVSRALRRPIVVTGFVLIEVSNVLSSVAARERAVTLWDRLINDPSVAVAPASTQLVVRGLELYSRHADKDWSLTDCISFIVMKEFGLAEALTADHHFEQAGYEAMLLT